MADTKVANLRTTDLICQFFFFLTSLHPVPVRFKGPGDDLICLERLNVLTGLVFEEGGEPSLEPPVVC